MTAEVIRERLRAVAPLLAAEGKLIRPTVACAGVSAEDADDRFWCAVAAVQLAHEASLVHDDIIDRATHRRGRPTDHVTHGIGRAIVKGDQLLAAGYSAAAATGSIAFVNAFANAVQMTIAGEIAQAERLGHVLRLEEYEAIIAMKSGDLIGCALAARAFLDGDEDMLRTYVRGRSIGALYQKIDDLLDYLPYSKASKPVFGDFRQGRWTWPLLFLRVPFGADIESDLNYRLLRLCIEYVEAEAASLIEQLDGNIEIIEMIEGWLAQVRTAAIESWLERRMRASADRTSYFSSNSKSFFFAARLLGPEYREAVQSIYAFCRFTDDLADEADDAPVSREDILDYWETRARAAHAGVASGLSVIDDAMRVTPDFSYVEQLIEGMRMDLSPRRYRSMDELKVYTHRAAGVVGQWLTSVFGISDSWVLERAALLGHAMQLTNILRDVGEDWRSGRLYLPLDRMRFHGVSAHDIARVAATGEVTNAYQRLMTELIGEADKAYALAHEAIPRLPGGVQRAIGAAARIYQGIHDSLRANGFNNGTRRATTTLLTKVLRALPAMLMVGLLVAAPARAQMHEAWSAAGQDEAKLPDAWTTLAVLQTDSVTRAAYRGALELLEARYAEWPPTRLARARRGIGMLDRAAAEAPDNIEVRYLRLFSHANMPGFLRNEKNMRADEDAVRRLLPAARTAVAPETFQAIRDFMAGYSE